MKRKETTAARAAARAAAFASEFTSMPKPKGKLKRRLDAMWRRAIKRTDVR